MKKNILKESYEWSVIKKTNGGGGTYFVVYIDPKLSEDTYQYKDQIKKFGAKWDGKMKAWCFNVSSDPSTRTMQIERFVKPCVVFLKSVETQPGQYTSDEQLNNIIKQIDELIQNIDTNPTVLTTEVNTTLDPKEIKEKLAKFKQELIDSFSNESWKQKMMPIIKFKKAQGPAFSILNSILVWIQDPQATMVKSRTNWKEANRKVKPGAPAICLYLPHGKKIVKNEQDKRTATIEWLQKMGKIQNPNVTNIEIQRIVNGLTVGEKERLRKYLNSLETAVSFTLEPNWFDVRYTEQIEGTEDLIGSQDELENIPWYDGVSQETEKSAQLYDAILKSIIETGVKVSYSDEKELGGARGVSMNGEIRVLKDVPKSPGTVSTLIHEFSHELLHQKYLQSKDEYSRYFVGTQQGRGVVEQQAEISAWLVMRNFGYDMKTAINYAGIWGADETKIVKVFDTVASVANFIIDKMTANLNTMSESKLNEARLTGLDVAKILGPEVESMYLDSAKQMKTAFRTKFNEMFERINKNYFYGDKIK